MWLLLILATGRGIVIAFNTPARHSLISELVPCEEPRLAEWGDVFGDPVVATPLDRLRHHAVVVRIEGSSYRMREHVALVPENLAPTHSIHHPSRSGAAALQKRALRSITRLITDQDPPSR